MAKVNQASELSILISDLHRMFEEKDGVLLWREKPVGSRKADWRMAGVSSKGYIRVGIHGHTHAAHRIIWAMHNGSWPTSDIDHIDGNRENNNITNLRVVCRADNCKNSSIRKDNTSGLVGVSFNKMMQKWETYISTSKGRERLGMFSSLFEAACVRKSAELDFGYHLGHGKQLRNK